MFDPTLTDLAVYAVIGSVAAVAAGLLLGLYLGLSTLFARRKEGVSRREVLPLVPYALKSYVDWRALVRAIPKVAAVGALLFVVVTIFGVGLLEVIG